MTDATKEQENWPSLGGRVTPPECAECRRTCGPDGHDPCLGDLPGDVANACCGHTDPATAYVQAHGGEHFTGYDAWRRIVQLLRTQLAEVTRERDELAEKLERAELRASMACEQEPCGDCPGCAVAAEEHAAGRLG